MKLNGVTVRLPSSIKVDIEHIDQAERNAKGDILIDGIAVKRKLTFNWNYLSVAEAKTIFENTSIVATRIIAVTDYPDPVTGSLATRNMYTSTKSGEAMKMGTGMTIGWRNVSLNCIE
jgi:hypothetical protein